MVTLWLRAIVTVALLFAEGVVAQQVYFDVSRTVVCTEIGDSSSPLHPIERGQKLVQARVSVSLLAYRGEAEAITECLYQFESGTNTTQMIDYLPRTTMDTNVAGNIQVQKSSEVSDQVNLSVSAGIDSIRANGGGAKSDSSRAAFSYELIPPQEMVAAVGTIGRGTGVYFKLRRTPQISLEGSREFLITLQVPVDWRGGYFRATCQAVRRSNRNASVLGSRTFIVPIYLAGDSIARRLAEDFADAEQLLYASARKHQHDVHRRSLPTIAHELSLVDPKIPTNWLDQVVAHPSVATAELGFERRLPTEIVAAIDGYREARRALVTLRTDGSASTPPSRQTRAAVELGGDAAAFVRADVSQTPAN